MSLIAAALILQAEVAAADCRGGLCDARRLEPFLKKLAKARDAGSGATGRPVRIIQIGDSHSAGDQVTGTWRALLQNRYGSGGRGVLAPGRPYAGYLTRGVTVRESPGWTHSGIFGAAWRGSAAGPVGLAAYSAAAAAAGATMSLRADPSQPFDRLTVCAIRGPDAGAISLTIGQASVTWSLTDDRVHADCTAIDSAGVTADAGVDVLLEQVGGEAVPQRVRADPLADARGLGRLAHGTVQLPRRDRVWMPPVLQGDFPTFWRLGAYIARVSGLFAWLIVCHWPVCSSKNEVHIGSESYDARAPGLVSTS